MFDLGLGMGTTVVLLSDEYDGPDAEVWDDSDTWVDSEEF